MPSSKSEQEAQPAVIKSYRVLLEILLYPPPTTHTHTHTESCCTMINGADLMLASELMDWCCWKWKRSWRWLWYDLISILQMTKQEIWLFLQNQIFQYVLKTNHLQALPTIIWWGRAEMNQSWPLPSRKMWFIRREESYYIYIYIYIYMYIYIYKIIYLCYYIIELLYNY